MLYKAPRQRSCSSLMQWASVIMTKKTVFRVKRHSGQLCIGSKGVTLRKVRTKLKSHRSTTKSFWKNRSCKPFRNLITTGDLNKGSFSGKCKKPKDMTNSLLKRLVQNPCWANRKIKNKTSNSLARNRCIWRLSHQSTKLSQGTPYFVEGHLDAKKTTTSGGRSNGIKCSCSSSTHGSAGCVDLGEWPCCCDRSSWSGSLIEHRCSWPGVSDQQSSDLSRSH